MNIITASKIATAPLNSSGLMWLEKAESGQVIVEDIKDALQEFSRLFKAGISSKAEILTLARAFPENRQYTEAAGKVGEDEPMVIGGPASVSLIDREGHLITTDALKRAFTKFMSNFRTRNAMVLHSDVQVGWALPAYITKGGQIFKSGVDDKGLFFICELRDDTKISEKVMKEINEGRLKSYSIAGSALKVQNMQKGLVPYMQVDEMELAEVTVCEKGVNQNAGFELLKAEMPQTGKIDKDQCEYRNATMEESMRGENCGHCKFFNAQDKTCDTVSGDIQSGDWCKIFAPMEQQPKKAKVVVIMRDKQNVDFKKSFDMWMEKADTVKDPLKAKESMATLQNFAGREAEQHQLLREFGFPSEQPSESSRYTPVIETETTDKGVPIHIKPPWVVNEAGQDLGEKLDEDSPEYHKSAKAKNRKSGAAVQKMSDLFIHKAPRPMSDEERKLDMVRPRGEERGRKPPVGTRKKNVPPAKSIPQESDESKIQRQRARGGVTVPFKPPPEYVDSPKGRAEAAGADVRDAAESQAAFQQRAGELSSTARRTKRMDDTQKRREWNRYMNAETAFDQKERTDPRGASYTGAPGQKKTESVAETEDRKDLESRVAEHHRLLDLQSQRNREERVRKKQAGEESSARRTPGAKLGRVAQRLRRGGQRAKDYAEGAARGFTEDYDFRTQSGITDKIGRQEVRSLVSNRPMSEGVQHGARLRTGIDRGLAAARRVGSEFGAGVKESVKPSVYSPRQRKDELTPKQEKARADKSGTSKWQQRGREIGRGAASLYRGFKDKPDEQGQYMGYRGEGTRGQKQRELGREGRAAFDWASGNMPFFSEEARAKRAADKRFAGSAVQPGGWEGRNMDYDGHVGEFKSHNERVQSTGHDTHENFLHNLQRLGMTKDNKTMFNVRHGKNVGSKMGDTVHAHDFLAGEGKDWDIEIHPDFKQHANAIMNYIHGDDGYFQHLAGAPGRGVGATHGGGEASQTMAWTTPQTEQPVSTTAAIPHGPQQPTRPAVLEQPGGSMTSLGGATSPPSPSVPPSKKFGAAPSPKEQNPALFKKSRTYILDSMLLKALGVRYVTK